jgi:hypothetical protein
MRNLNKALQFTSRQSVRSLSALRPISTLSSSAKPISSRQSPKPLAEQQEWHILQTPKINSYYALATFINGISKERNLGLEVDTNSDLSIQVTGFPINTSIALYLYKGSIIFKRMLERGLHDTAIEFFNDFAKHRPGDAHLVLKKYFLVFPRITPQLYRFCWDKAQSMSKIGDAHKVLMHGGLVNQILSNPNKEEQTQVLDAWLSDLSKNNKKILSLDLVLPIIKSGEIKHFKRLLEYSTSVNMKDELDDLLHNIEVITALSKMKDCTFLDSLSDACKSKQMELHLSAIFNAASFNSNVDLVKQLLDRYNFEGIILLNAFNNTRVKSVEKEILEAASTSSLNTAAVGSMVYRSYFEPEFIGKIMQTSSEEIRKAILTKLCGLAQEARSFRSHQAKHLAEKEAEKPEKSIVGQTRLETVSQKRKDDWLGI